MLQSLSSITAFGMPRRLGVVVSVAEGAEQTYSENNRSRRNRRTRLHWRRSPACNAERSQCVRNSFEAKACSIGPEKYFSHHGVWIRYASLVILALFQGPVVGLAVLGDESLGLLRRGPFEKDVNPRLYRKVYPGPGPNPLKSRSKPY